MTSLSLIIKKTERGVVCYVTRHDNKENEEGVTNLVSKSKRITLMCLLLHKQFPLTPSFRPSHTHFLSHNLIPVVPPFPFSPCLSCSSFLLSFIRSFPLFTFCFFSFRSCFLLYFTHVLTFLFPFPFLSFLFLFTHVLTFLFLSPPFLLSCFLFFLLAVFSSLCPPCVNLSYFPSFPFSSTSSFDCPFSLLLSWITN